MTKEEVEQAFNGLSPYYAYKQGVQDGAAYNEESFRREAAMRAMQGILVNSYNRYDAALDKMVDILPANAAFHAVAYADALIAKLKEK